MMLARIRLARGGCEPLVQVQFPWAAVVKLAIGDAGVSLQFNQRNSRADRVDGARRQIEKNCPAQPRIK